MVAVSGGCSRPLRPLGRALLLLLAALSSTVLATGLSGDFVPCAVAGDGDAYGSVEPHSEFSGGFMSRLPMRGMKPRRSQT